MNRKTPALVLPAPAPLSPAGGSAAPPPPPSPSLPAALASRNEPVSLEMAGRPLAEVVPAVSRAAGASLSVAPELAAAKVVVRFSNLPLSRALQALAAGVDGVWQERPPPAAAGEYRLVP